MSLTKLEVKNAIFVTYFALYSIITLHPKWPNVTFSFTLD